MPTGKKAASDAGKVLKDSKATKNEKTVAGSDLSGEKEIGRTAGGAWINESRSTPTVLWIV